MARKKKLIDKQAKKRADGECKFCGESDYAVLDVHRIVPGEEGGEYTEHNTVTVCACCHRRCHDGQIVIDRKYQSTKGVLLHYWIGDQEFWD